ncbi:LANO_0G16138g1_1 [Lachancea nothofagi CBS 11611]|uniref:LANO_0G16138g1_1 n=1 Tax=Lachancea nothofagi CBS 11611 TaxID=1266666 RepID=A0A1G4KKQ2_9SACH|nr:LANO_0G16138g1_1 [Lachancea nothofagi CBS 11611]
MLPAGVILVFVLVFLAFVLVVSTVIFKRVQAKKKGLQKF